MPKAAAIRLPVNWYLCERIDRIFVAGMNERMIETVKIMVTRSRNILMVSKMKKFMASANMVLGCKENALYVTQSANCCIG